MSNPGGSGGSGSGLTVRGKPYAFDQTHAFVNIGTGAASPQTNAVGANIPAGELAIIAFCVKSALPTSTLAVTDSKGNTWTIGADVTDGVNGVAAPVIVLAWSVLTTPLITTDTISITGATSVQGDMAGAISAFTVGGVVPIPTSNTRSSFNSNGKRLSMPLPYPTGALLIGAGVSNHSGDGGDISLDTRRSSGWTEFMAPLGNGQSKLEFAWKIAGGSPEQYAVKATDFPIAAASLAFA